MPIPRKPIASIPANPVGARSWHVQIERKTHPEDGAVERRFVRCGGSEGNRSYAYGYMVGRRVGEGLDGREMRLCDAHGNCYVVG